jgi:hypothetical protein
MAIKKKALPVGRIKEIRECCDEIIDQEDKSTKIIYKKLPGNMVMIVGFKNFMSAGEIKNQCGDDVLMAYRCKDYMVKSFNESNGIPQLIVPDGNGLSKYLYIDDLLSDDEFSKIIASIKKCGNVLHELIVAFKTDSNVKEIKI